MIGALFECNIKYELLTSMLEDYLNNIKYSNNVNVIIDLKSLYKKAYRTDVNTICSEQQIVIEDIASSVLNIIGHYRNFLYKSGKYSQFYIFYSTKECNTLKDINNKYKEYYYNKYINNTSEYLNMNNIIKSTTKQVQIVCKYLPDVFFIDTSKLDEFMYTNHLIRNIVNKNDLNIILSSDPIIYQTLNKNTIAIDLKGNNSKVITETNVINYLTKSDKYKISGNLLNLVLSICGDEEYSLNKIEGYGYKKAANIIEGMVNENKLTDNIHMTYPTILNNHSLIANNQTIVEDNFKLVFPIDIAFQNNIQLTSSFVINKPKVTYKQFLELNNRIFLYYPLNITSLLKGVLI